MIALIHPPGAGRSTYGFVEDLRIWLQLKIKFGT